MSTSAMSVNPTTARAFILPVISPIPTDLLLRIDYQVRTICHT